MLLVLCPATKPRGFYPPAQFNVSFLSAELACPLGHQTPVCSSEPATRLDSQEGIAILLECDKWAVESQGDGWVPTVPAPRVLTFSPAR